MKRFIGIIVLFLLLTSTAVFTNAAAQVPSVPDTVPDGLTATEWNNIQKQVMAKMSASEQAILRASNAGADDLFGVSVAVAGDTAVVGAYLEDGASNSGAAYVFERNAGGVGNWGETAVLRASNAGASDQFGRSVAVSDDTVVVGAYTEDGAEDGLSNSGAAYVFERNQGGAGNWGETAVLRASNAGADDLFGISVAVSGDTAIVGANQEDGAGDGLSNSGAAYVFERNKGGVGNWGETAVLRASNAGANDWFGYSVAVAGDTAVVGARQEDGAGDGLSDSGAAYVFERDAGGVGNWGETAVLRASNAGAFDEFGFSVAVSGDTAVVGAWYEDGAGDGLTDSGAAYLFGPCVRSAQSGNWQAAATWVGGVPPTSIDGACIQNGHTVTLAAPAAANTVLVEAGGVLDLATFGFTAENSVHNYGTMRQTQVVGASSTVNFLQIRDSGDTADLYRGVDIATGVNLGSTVVEVRGNTAVCNNNDGGAYRNRCFMVNPTNAGTVNITLHSTAAEDDLSDDAFFQYDSGTTWIEGATCADGVNVGGACTGSATFASPAWFLIGSAGNDPTAVTNLQTDVTSATGQGWLVALLVGLLGVLTTAVVLRLRHS